MPRIERLSGNKAYITEHLRSYAGKAKNGLAGQAASFHAFRDF
jgi:hypothetical protein